ncbi:radical SAM protein [Maioricimonas rarisocia]|nr:radical SAM protein [Maioricimonas rarisocia]
MSAPLPRLTTAEILAARGAKNALDPYRPYAYLVEPEHAASGRVEDVATLFLTNRECPFRCLMCDLWKNTTDETVPVGAVPAQIDYALERLGPAQHIKLYNSGNFFDPRAIPREDHAAIAERVNGFETVIVENHPRFCSEACGDFQERIGTQLEVAIGLETIHPDVLPALNKQMTLDDYDRAVERLLADGIRVRTFILLRPPGLTEEEGLEWALKSVEHAFSIGVDCCAVIPTRAGNGIMEHLGRAGTFAPPSLSSLEAVLDAGLAMNRGRVFVDLWDIEQLYDCRECGPARAERLKRMNLSQTPLPRVACTCGAGR